MPEGTTLRFARADPMFYAVEHLLNAVSNKVIAELRAEKAGSHNSVYVNYEHDKPVVTPRYRYRRNVRGNAQVVDDGRNPTAVGDTFGGGSSKHSYGSSLQLRNSSPMPPPDFTNPPEVTHYAPVAEVFDPDTPEGSLRELKRVEAAAWQGFHEEMRNKKRSAVACQGFLGQVIRVQEAQAKIRAEMRNKGTGRMPVEWERVKERIIKALESHPQALAAVLEALDEA